MFKGKTPSPIGNLISEAGHRISGDGMPVVGIHLQTAGLSIGSGEMSRDYSEDIQYTEGTHPLQQQMAYLIKHLGGRSIDFSRKYPKQTKHFSDHDIKRITGALYPKAIEKTFTLEYGVWRDEVTVRMYHYSNVSYGDIEVKGTVFYMDVETVWNPDKQYWLNHLLAELGHTPLPPPAIHDKIAEQYVKGDIYGNLLTLDQAIDRAKLK